jgi:RNA polymerase sigma-54 factor
MDMSHDLSSDMRMKVSPRLVAASYILELSSLELQEAINEELNDNPALELLERANCSVCGGTLQGSICPHCLSQQKIDPKANNGEVDFTDDYVPEYNIASPADDDFDPLTQVASQMTLGERLLNDLQAILPAADLKIAAYLVGNLDESGYLQCSIEEVADEYGVEIERVMAVLAALQSMEPVGIGARDLRECLIIQINYLEEQGISCQGVREIVTTHFSALGEHKFSRIAHDLGMTVDQVSAACEFIKRRLNPFPSQGYNGPDSRGAAEGRSTYVWPDVVVNEREGEFEIEVIESRRFFLRVTPLYQQLMADAGRGTEKVSDNDQRHIKQYVSRAKLFIANINQRRQTLQKITQCIVNNQKDFLRHGIRYLKPLTRAAVAAELGMHESTVSRATASKYIMLPNREVIAFSKFFTASLSVMDVIRELIGAEASPMTDQEIAHELSKRGIYIARRTVAKYREQLGILPSSLR